MQFATHTYYVSPQGSDSKGDGTQQAPWNTLAYAMPRLCPGDELVLRGGTYREILRPAVQGTKEAPIRISAYPGELPEVTALEPIRGWKRVECFPSFTLEKGEENPPVYAADCPLPFGRENQIFEDGGSLCEARWPHNTGRSLLDPVFAKVEDTDGFSVVDSHIPGTREDIAGCYLWCIGGAAWVAWNNPILDFNEDKREILVAHDDKNPGYGHFYSPRVGNDYVLMGKKGLLGAPGEWWYEEGEKRLYAWTKEGDSPEKHRMEYKARKLTADFSGISHYEVEGITFLGGGILTDEASSYLRLSSVRVFYPYHCFLQEFSSNPVYGSVNILGAHIALENSELAYSSGSIVSVRGKFNRVFNCYIHDGGYAAVWTGAFSVAGYRNLISSNTICYSGRDLVTIHGIREGVLEYNDLHHSGCITSDLGLTYGHNTDGNGTVLRYNYVHDNMADDCAFGIYFDHLSHNFIVHDNWIENLRNDPVRFNNPGYFDQVFHNRAANAKETKTFDHADRQDIFGMRFMDNIVNDAILYPEHADVRGNEIIPDYRLEHIPSWGRGKEALSYEGIDLETEHPVWDKKEYPYSSHIYNGCFECDALCGWSVAGDGKASLAEGNGWGHIPYHATGTSFHELKLEGNTIVFQTVSGLLPGADYVASGWLKCKGSAGYFGLVLGENQPVDLQRIQKEALAVTGDHKSMGVELSVEKTAFCKTHKETWQRYILRFRAGEDGRAVLLFAKEGDTGEVRCDNAFLCLTGRPVPNHTGG